MFVFSFRFFETIGYEKIGYTIIGDVCIGCDIVANALFEQRKS